MSERVFDWTQRKAWIADVRQYTRRLLTRRVQINLAQARPQCWSDDFDWLEIKDGPERFAERFCRFYSHIKAFHACRPTDVGAYLTKGLRGQSPEIIEDAFVQVFSDVPRNLLDAALDEFRDRRAREQGKLWIVLSKRELLEDSGHYLIQGSEYLMALAATLTRLHPVEDYRLRLRGSGVPTIFEAHIPVELFPSAQIESLARLVLSEWGQEVSNRPLHMDAVPCLTLRQTVSAEHLVSHTHPAEIPDPHFRGTYYNTITTCPYCAN